VTTGTVDIVVRTAFRLRWLPRHVLALILIAALILLGRWQWDVSESQRGGLQNLLYAFQWWAMAAMVVYGWWRLLRDDVYGRPAAGLTTARRVMTPDDSSWDTFDINAPAIIAAREQEEREPDPELVEYNHYLLRLNARAERAR
jgi:DNA-binding transcriptional regulator of glucitol operon